MRKGSQPRTYRTENNYFYVTGRLKCNKTVRVNTKINFFHELTAYSLPSRMYPLRFDTKFNSSYEGRGIRLLGYEWSLPENWGVWSDGNLATMNFELEEIPKGDLLLELESIAYVNEQHPEQTIKIYINNHHIENLRYKYPSKPEVRKIFIPRQYLLEKNGFMNIEFRMNPLSPKDFGNSLDNRRLGIGIISMRLIEKNERID